MKAAHSFENFGTTDPTMQCYIPNTGILIYRMLALNTQI